MPARETARLGVDGRRRVRPVPQRQVSPAARPARLGSRGTECPPTVCGGPSRIPNVPAPQLLLCPGMVLASEFLWPSLRFDLASMLLGPGASLWAAGFYDKTFMWPSWRAYQRLIRHLAGLGRAPETCDLPRAEVGHRLRRARRRRRPSPQRCARGGGASVRVIVCEREPAIGGELEFEAATIEGLAARDWAGRAIAELDLLGATLLKSTAVVTAEDGLVIAHGQPAGMPGADTLHRIHVRAFVNAMGCVEHGIAFVGNDRPGVMLCGAADRLLGRYGVLPGRAIALFGNHDRLYATAMRLVAAGALLRAVIDTRRAAHSPLRAELAARGVESLLGHMVLAASGDPRVAEIRIADTAPGSRGRRLPCDTLLVSGGWSPAVNAGLQRGAWPLTGRRLPPSSRGSAAVALLRRRRGRRAGSGGRDRGRPPCRRSSKRRMRTRRRRPARE